MAALRSQPPSNRLSRKVSRWPPTLGWAGPRQRKGGRALPAQIRKMGTPRLPHCPPDGILSFLKSSKPGDALCVLGLTLSDLYPCEAWTFTFGKFLPGHGKPAPRTLLLRPWSPWGRQPLPRLPEPLLGEIRRVGGKATLEPTAQLLWVRGCWSRGPLYVDTPAGPLGPVVSVEGGPAPGLPELSLPLAHTPPHRSVSPQKWASAALPGSQRNSCSWGPAPLMWPWPRWQQTAPRCPCRTQARLCASAPWGCSSAAR